MQGKRGLAGHLDLQPMAWPRLGTDFHATLWRQNMDRPQCRFFAPADGLKKMVCVGVDLVSEQGKQLHSQYALTPTHPLLLPLGLPFSAPSLLTPETPGRNSWFLSSSSKGS
jgi:hypothetical protein